MYELFFFILVDVDVKGLKFDLDKLMKSGISLLVNVENLFVGEYMVFIIINSFDFVILILLIK